MNTLTTGDSDDDLRQKRTRAQNWVNGSVAAGVAAVVAVSMIPGLATATLCALEATMAMQIGTIYRGPTFTLADARSVAGVIGLASFAGKIVALEAATLLGPFAPVGKAAIAAGIIKGMGELVIRHFETLAKGDRR